MIKASVIIPTYRRPMLLKTTLQYLTRQTTALNEVEVIVVDDGSPDDETRLAVEGARVDYDLRYVYLPRAEDSCRSRTRNAGIAEARGEILIFLDDDMVVRPDFIAEHVRYHDYCEHLLVMGHRRYLNQEVTERLQRETLPTANLLEGAAEEERAEFFQNYSFNMQVIGNPWAYTYSFCLSSTRRTLDAFGIRFPEDYKGWGAEDQDFGFQHYRSGCKVVLNPRLEGYHQYHGPNEMTKAKLEALMRNDRIFAQKYHLSPAKITNNALKPLVRGPWVDQLIRKGARPRFYIARHLQKVADLKQALAEELAADPNRLAIVLDETRSDLDIWLQTEGVPATYPPLYYPADDPVASRVRQYLHRPEVEQVVF
jgi:glycosyltransferase involved in cell wall biosynthesis